MIALLLMPCCNWLRVQIHAKANDETLYKIQHSYLYHRCIRVKIIIENDNIYYSDCKALLIHRETKVARNYALRDFEFYVAQIKYELNCVRQETNERVIWIWTVYCVYKVHIARRTELITTDIVIVSGSRWMDAARPFVVALYRESICLAVL